ncbi:MAG: hypothetical protein HQ594_01840 [Candidatus Omnitrophica bacterium]|nr:hypothetical protein [Candidatus Omnitrophota bacterium]
MDDVKKDADFQAAETGEVVVNAEGSGAEDEEQVPIKAPLKVLKHCTINKKFGWWAAVVLLESYAKKQVCFYLWQKDSVGWKRKQKFGIHSLEDWGKMKDAVELFSGELK